MANCLVAQSGGPTAVINSSLAGVVRANQLNPLYDRVFGGLADQLALRQWGALANAVTLVVFIGTMLGSVIRGSRQPAGRSTRRRTG